MIGLRRSFWWILLLLFVNLIISRLPGFSGNPIYARLTIAFLIILVVSGIWSLLSLQGIDLERNASINRKQVGEIFSENFEVINRSIIPKPWLRVDDLAMLPGKSGSRVLTWVGGRQSRTYLAYTFLERRGWFALGPTEIISGDIFGLFLNRKKFRSYSMLLVIPHTVNIKYFPAPFGILPGGRALRQKTLEVTPYAAGVREFVQGDPLKRIHWPSSARKQRLIVKEFEKDPLAEVWLFLDAQESVHIHPEKQEVLNAGEILLLKKQKIFELPPDTEEYLISIAASIAKYYIEQKREVGLVAASRNFTSLPAERGERQLGKILETLAVLRANGETPLWGLISSQLSQLTRGSTIILITPSPDNRILTIIMELIQRGLMPVVILIDQASFGGETSLENLEGNLVNHGILTFLIRKGDNLKSTLETPKANLDTRLLYRRF